MQRTEPETGSEPIAIIGMAVRLPGANDVPAFWADLREGVERVERHTREEMLTRGVPPHLVDDPHWVNSSAPLDHADAFDAAFFGYAAREAATMDPQHRIFLECGYHALEDAGYDPSRSSDLIGVYAGTTMNTYVYHNLLNRGDVFDAIGDLQTMVGNDKDFLATRVSYKLNLQGPSLSVQTACSSSLVAVHIACRALLDDECDIALAGGSSLRLPHGAGYLANPGGTSSPDGHCRAFDEAAGGSVPGSGAGVVVLKRLSAALRDGDQIHAVVRATAISNDGQGKASFTAPSVDGQARAVARALERAGLSAREISYVEAHGTGTPLGDPIEVAALTRAFRHTTGDTGYCYLGSVKPNIGHLDAAAGIAGLVKAALILKHRKVPPVVNFSRANPRLELDTSPFVIPDELVPLDSDGPLRAGVNSIGMGGTNAHAILEEAPARPAADRPRGRQPVLLSARTPQQLDRMSEALGRWLREHPTASLPDVAYTLAVGRRQLEHRRAVVAADIEDASYALVTSGSSRQRTGHAPDAAQVALLLPGQGAQRAGMSARLAAKDRTFATHLDQCVQLFADRAGIDLRPLLSAQAEGSDSAQERLDETDHTQPALFAVEWALSRTLFDMGVRPAVLLGHSLGEWVAASLAGVFELEDAVDLVALRGRLMARSPAGRMLYVHLPAAEASQRLPAGLSVAAVNADTLVVVAGAPKAVEKLAAELKAEGTTCGLLAVNRAFHSPLVGDAAEELRAAMGDKKLSAPTMPVVSNVTGSVLDPQQAVDPAYWAEQMRLPVRFADGLRTVRDQGATVLLEAGPGTTLASLVPPDGQTTCIPLLAGDRTGADKKAPDLLDALCRVWSLGGAVDWDAYYAGRRYQRQSLPVYPFDRTRHWLDHVEAPDRAEPPAGPPERRERRLYRPTWRLRPLPAAGEVPGPRCVITRVAGGDAVPEGWDAVRLDRPDGDLDAGDLDGDGPVTLLLPVAASADAFEALAVLRAVTGSIAVSGPGSAGQVRLAVLTRGAARIEATGGGLAWPVAASLAATARVAAQEIPHLSACLLDLDEQGAFPAEGLGALAGTTGEVLALRDGCCWELTSVPVTGPDTPAPSPSPSAWLLIGGAGEFEEAFVPAALANGADKIVVLDQRATDGGAPEHVEHRKGDPRDVAELAKAVRGFGDGARVGVVHAMGLRDRPIGPLTELSTNDLQAHLDVTAEVARAIAELPQDVAIARVILVSGLAAAVGGVGGFAHAAADGWLDGFARQQDQPGGTRWTSVRWEHRHESAYAPHSAAEADAGDIARVLAAGAIPLLTAATADPPSQVHLRPRRRPAAGMTAKSAGDSPPGADTRTPMQRLIAGLWTELLGVEPVRPSDNFFDLGGQSLLAMQLMVGLRRKLGKEVPMIALFERPTLAAFADYVETMEVDPGADSHAVPAAPAEPDADEMSSLAAEVAAMSDEEVQRLLDQFEGEEGS